MRRLRRVDDDAWRALTAVVGVGRTSLGKHYKGIGLIPRDGMVCQFGGALENAEVEEFRETLPKIRHPIGSASWLGANAPSKIGCCCWAGGFLRQEDGRVCVGE